MKSGLRLLLSLLLISTYAFSQEKQIKKITMLEENNPVLNFDYKKLGLPDSIKTNEYTELKEYVLSNISLKSTDEPEIYFELMQWVSEQWEHNGWHVAPDSLNSLGILKSAKYDGQAYRCVEYGSVLHDVLIAFGYVARQVGIKNSEVDYGGAGMAHVVTEVWSNKYNKWVFLDPQWGIYAKHNGIPLNIYDIYKLKSSNQQKEIQFIKNGKTVKANEYRKFLFNYLGYIDIAFKNNNLHYSLSLKLEGKRNYMVFQGFPMGNNVFTKDVDKVYFPLNQTMVLLDYLDSEYERAQNEYSKLDIKSVNNFNKNMYLFAARPDFKLSLDNNMPWFDHYKVKLNNKIIKAKIITLPEGINTIEVTAVNKNGIEGIPTTLKIKYE